MMNSSRRSSANAASSSTIPIGRPVPMPNTPSMPTMNSAQMRKAVNATRPSLRPNPARQALPRSCQSELAFAAPGGAHGPGPAWSARPTAGQ